MALTDSQKEMTMQNIDYTLKAEIINAEIKRCGDWHDKRRYSDKLEDCTRAINSQIANPVTEDDVNRWLGNYVEDERLPFAS